MCTGGQHDKSNICSSFSCHTQTSKEKKKRKEKRKSKRKWETAYVWYILNKKVEIHRECTAPVLYNIYNWIRVGFVKFN